MLVAKITFNNHTQRYFVSACFPFSQLHYMHHLYACISMPFMSILKLQHRRDTLLLKVRPQKAIINKNNNINALFMQTLHY